MNAPTEAPAHPDAEARAESRAWWQARRGRYNLALVATGMFAFVGYCGAVEICIARNSDPDAEITLFTMAFQAVGYLFAMAIANVCYGLGPLAERIIRPRNAERFRRRLFAAGLLFSVMLPLSIPVLAAYDCGTRPSLPERQAMARAPNRPES